MLPEAIVTTLKSLKLFGMAHAIEELAAQNSPAYLNAQSILDSLLKAELAEREVRSVNYQMKIARFPAYRDLSGFDFSQSVVNEALVRHLHRGEFMDSAHNVVLIGGPGTGKTHLATAISVQVIMHAHQRVRFFSTVDLVNALEQEKQAGKQVRIPRKPSTHNDLKPSTCSSRKPSTDNNACRHAHPNGLGSVFFYRIWGSPWRAKPGADFPVQHNSFGCTILLQR